MAKQTVIIQLVVDSRVIWQVKQDVPREHCRRMTTEELNAIGGGVVDVLAGIIATQKTAAESDRPAAAPEPSRRKR